jgi:hypothetical protein
MSMTFPIIPEDSWVSISEYRGRRLHKVFATNGDVLTYCNRWLKRDRVALAGLARLAPNRCRLCEKAAVTA